MFGPKLFVVITPDLVRETGSALDAYVLAWIDFRINSEKNTEVYEREGGFWWRLTVESLAAETGLSVKTARRALERLLENGFLVSDSHSLRGVTDRAKSYRLAPDLRPDDLPFREGLSLPKRASLPSIKVRSNTRDQETAREEHPNFQEWYGIYPRKSARAAAARAFPKALAVIEYENLLEATKAFRAVWDARPKAETNKFCPHPASWLNGRRWEDVDTGSSEFDELVEKRDAVGLEKLTGVRYRPPNLVDVDDLSERSRLSQQHFDEWVVSERPRLIESMRSRTVS